MSSPTQDEPPRERLARLMDERRADLGLYWHEVAEVAGLTREGLRKIRTGKRAMQTESKLGLERALHWERGSINTILAGGDPTPIEPAATDRPELKAVPDPEAGERERRAKRLEELAHELLAEAAEWRRKPANE